MAQNNLNVYLAADFGAGSGRLMAGILAEGTLTLEEIYRFPNRQVKLGNHIYWDFLSLFQDLKEGLKLAAQRDYYIKSIGIDTWGVDFALIDAQGNLMSNPICYRDNRTDEMPEKVFQRLDVKQHYAETGIQVMPINTLFQLISLKESDEAQLKHAQHLLFMPDLFSYYLTGIANNEYCIASTSELLDARRRTWSDSLIQRLGLPRHLFGDIVLPGTVRGTLKSDICRYTGLPAIDVIAVGSHDTASAVAAVPFSDAQPKAFLSSGTWSLLGVETDEPILTEEARKACFTNEGGIGGTIRFLQNITGLWIVQRLMAEWKAKGEEQNYSAIIAEASNVSIDSTIVVDDASFANPDCMEEAIKKYCRSHRLTIPDTKAQLMRCVLQSLAAKYKEAVDRMNGCLPKPITQLNVIGGGSLNTLLNQLTADELGIPVLAGPVEATAMGNILIQALAKGDIADYDELRQIIKKSVKPKVYNPAQTE